METIWSKFFWEIEEDRYSKDKPFEISKHSADEMIDIIIEYYQDKPFEKFLEFFSDVAHLGVYPSGDYYDGNFYDISSQKMTNDLKKDYESGVDSEDKEQQRIFLHDSTTLPAIILQMLAFQIHPSEFDYIKKLYTFAYEKALIENYYYIKP